MQYEDDMTAAIDCIPVLTLLGQSLDVKFD